MSYNSVLRFILFRLFIMLLLIQSICRSSDDGTHRSSDRVYFLSIFLITSQVSLIVLLNW